MGVSDGAKDYASLKLAGCVATLSNEALSGEEKMRRLNEIFDASGWRIYHVLHRQADQNEAVKISGAIEAARKMGW